jgi:transposase-like protein
MYTTNIIEGLNRQFRKVTKTKSAFTNDTSLEKNAIPGVHERVKEMDSAIQKLGHGLEPTQYPV